MKKEVTLVGMGCGPLSVTKEAENAIKEAKLILGSARMLSLLPKGVGARVAESSMTEPLYDEITGAKEDRIAVLYSGDVGFYSGAPKLYKMLLEQEITVRMIPGVSVLSYLAAALGIPWQDIRVKSAHGVECDAVAAYKEASAPLLLLTSDGKGAADICRDLAEAGYGDDMVIIGQRLGYVDESITREYIKNACDMEISDLNVLLFGAE